MRFFPKISGGYAAWVRGNNIEVDRHLDTASVIATLYKAKKPGFYIIVVGDHEEVVPGKRNAVERAVEVYLQIQN